MKESICYKSSVMYPTPKPKKNFILNSSALLNNMQTTTLRNSALHIINNNLRVSSQEINKLPSDDNKNRVVNKVYREQLLEQIKEQEERKLKSRQRKVEEGKLYEKEWRKYYYFEREGGGAPMRDMFGHIIANRGLLFKNAIRNLQSNRTSLQDEMKDINERLKKKYYADLKAQIETRQSIT